MQPVGGAYAAITSFLSSNGLSPNVAAVMFFVNRVPVNSSNPIAIPSGPDCPAAPPNVTGAAPYSSTCDTQYNGAGTGQAPECLVQQVMENEIQAAFGGSPSIQTYFVVLNNDSTMGATQVLPFYQEIAADLPQAVQTLDATSLSQTALMMGGTAAQQAKTDAANFANVVSALGTCLYQLPAEFGSTAPSMADLQISYSVPGAPPGAAVTRIQADPNCTAANVGMASVDGWNIDNGRIRVCGNSCTKFRQEVTVVSGAALATGQPVPDVPLNITNTCTGASGSAGADATAGGG
jgi:hypothetical protein